MTSIVLNPLVHNLIGFLFYFALKVSKCGRISHQHRTVRAMQVLTPHSTMAVYKEGHLPEITEEDFMTGSSHTRYVS